MSLRDLTVAGLAVVLIAAIAVTALVRGAEEPAPAERVADAEQQLSSVREMERPPTPGECRDLREAVEEARTALAGMQPRGEPAEGDAAATPPAEAAAAEDADADPAALAERLEAVAAFLDASC